MIITYICEKCSEHFSGHWDQEDIRQIQFPTLILGGREITKVCPKCGHYNKRAKNIDSDEEY